jgi:hypothetical protein
VTVIRAKYYSQLHFCVTTKCVRSAILGVSKNIHTSGADMRSSVQKYQIRIKGYISDDWFEGLTIRREGNGQTVISGELPDQTALHGVLMIIRDLGLTLVEVKCIHCEINL